MFTGLSVVHLACVFDQEDVLEYFVKLAGMARGKLILKLKSSPFGQVCAKPQMQMFLGFLFHWMVN